MINKELWLDHLMYATPIEGYGNRMSMFLISLEAWRRGINVKFYTIDDPDNRLLIRYELSHNDRSFSFNSSLSHQLPEVTYNLCQDKHLTKKKLSEHGIRVPKGEKLSKDTESAYLSKLANELTYPVVMKPVGENAGKGVFSNITDEDMLFDTFAHLTKDLEYDEVILEEFIKGEEHRLLSVGDKVVGVVKRVPANVVGNGKDTIKQLIEAKNKGKQANPVIYSKTIEIDREVKNNLEQLGYTLEDVLEDGKQLYLRSKSNISTGGDTIDVMDEVDPSVIEMGEKAARAIPGLELGGIDMLIDPKTNEKAIIEVNTKPMIGLHIFPEQGKPRDVVKDIVDFYFPETKEIKRSRFYFDFERITSRLDHVTARSIKLEHPPSEEYYAKRFLVFADRGNRGFRSEVRRTALAEGLYGYAKGVKRNVTEIILASPDQEKVDQFFERHYQDTEYPFEIKEEEIWEYPINVGFVTSRYSDNMTLAEKHIRNVNREIRQLSKSHEKEIEQLSNRLNKIDRQRTIYKNAFNKLETQKKELKTKKKKQERKIKKKKSKEKEIKQISNRLNKIDRQRTIYKNAFNKLETQKKELKTKQKKQARKIKKQKQEIKALKNELNNTLYRRLVRSKRV